MRSALILGSGRSGTSMVAGSLAASGAYQGDDLYAARACNPKGFFESPEINGLNEVLMRPALAPGPELVDGGLWLGTTLADRPLASGPEIDARLRALCSRRPFVYKDPRFTWTLPAWRPHLGDAGLVCVFRHPSLTVRSIVEEVSSADYLDAVEFGPDDARRLWITLHERLLHEAERDDWLFLHYDQALASDGLDRLARFLDASLDRGFADRTLRRASAPDDPGPRALELYRELCARAGIEDPAPRVFPAARANLPRAIGFAVVRDGDLEALPNLLEDLGAQRGVALEPVLVDDTRARSLEAALPDGAAVRVVEPPRHSVARALSALADEAPILAAFAPGTRALPHRTARAIEALDATDGALAMCHALGTTDLHGQIGSAGPLADDSAGPGALWEGRLTLRAEALADLDPRAFRPVLLDRTRALAAAGRLASLDEALTLAPETDVAEARAATEAELRWLALEREPRPERPSVTVLLAHHRRPDAVYECLESICRQTVGPGGLELIVIDDNSPLEQVEALRALELPVPLTVLRQDGGGAANARNLGLPHARGEWVLFVNDDTIADPDLVERHLAAHAHIGRPAVVLGHFRQPDEALDNALLDLLERTTLLFGFTALEPGAKYDGTLLYTCNASVPLEAVHAVGDFDPDFSHYGCEDTDLGLRLEDAGLPTFYRPECRALHRHRIGVATIERRQPLVGRAHARLFAKHPRAFGHWTGMDWDDEREARRRLRAAHDALEPLSRTVRTLGSLDLGALRRADADLGPFVETLEGTLDRGLRCLNSPLWWRGFLWGFEEQRVHGFAELLARTPFAVEGAEGPFALLRVRGGHLGWLEVAEHWFAAAPHAETLLLWTDAADGLSGDQVERLIAPMRQRARAAGRPDDAVLVETDLDRRSQARLMAVAERWLATGDEHDVDDAERAAEAGVVEEDRTRWALSAPRALGVEFPWRVLHRPRWSDPDEARALAERVRPMVGARDAGLVLPHAPDEDTEAYLAALGLALDELGRSDAELGDAELEVVLRPCTDVDDERRLFAACDASTTAIDVLTTVGDAWALARFLERRRAFAAEPLARLSLSEPRTAAPWPPTPAEEVVP